MMQTILKYSILCCLSEFLLLASSAANSGVEITNNEIWYKQRGAVRATQLTADKLPKDCASLSPDGKRILYMIAGNGENKLETAIVLLSVSGRRLWQVLPEDLQGEPYCSINSLDWIDDNRIGVDCHLSPSSSRYLVVDAKAGRTIADYLGLNFAWSPDCSKLAHVGHIVHFSYPYEHCYKLEINDKVLYPRKYGIFGSDASVHEFITPFAWTKDSQAVAFVDNVARRFLVVLHQGRPAVVVALTDMGCVRSESIKWMGKERVAVNYPNGYAPAQVIPLTNRDQCLTGVSEVGFRLDLLAKSYSLPIVASQQETYRHDFDTKLTWSPDGKSAAFVDRVSQRFLVVASPGAGSRMIALKGNCVRFNPKSVDWVSRSQVRISFADKTVNNYLNGDKQPDPAIVSLSNK